MSGSVSRARRLAQVRPSDLRAVLWANGALSNARRDLREHGARAVVAAPPVGLPESALPAIRTLLNKRRATCLERALVLQRWLAAHGRPLQVAIGVGKLGEQFVAHAWLPGFDLNRESAGYREIRRLDP